MRILMTGATGLIGRELGRALAARGDKLVCLVRDVSAARRRLPFPAECHPWDHTRPVPVEALHGVEAVVNLAGEPVADRRWTPAKKALIRDSRVRGTQQLVQAVLQHGPGSGRRCGCRSCVRASCWRARVARWPRCCRCSGCRRPAGWAPAGSG